MSAACVLVETALFETRAVAMDAEGRAFAHYIARAGEPRRFAALHTVDEAVVRARTGADFFVALKSGPEAFLRGSAGAPLTLGQRVWVRVVAEARREKLARVSLTAEAPSPMSGLDLWRQNLPGGFGIARTDVSPGDAQIAAAFDEALSPSVALAGGGTLHIEPARALIAADIDAGPREGKGSAAARALSLNRVAAEALARQFALRNLGGNLVLDCVAPLNKDSGAKVRAMFLETCARYMTRPAKALAPSPLGLMEASIAWGAATLHNRLLKADHQPTDETIVFDGLRELEREARAQPMARLTLALPEEAFRWLKANLPEAQGRLNDAFGARLTLAVHAGQTAPVFASPSPV